MLGLPQPHLFTGQAYRRTGANMVDNNAPTTTLLHALEKMEVGKNCG
jgi:hypothetical protein